jgi:hypothetical protein
MGICMGNPADQSYIHMHADRLVAHCLEDSNGVATAVFFHHPEWDAVSAIGGIRAVPFNNGEFAVEFCQRFNELGVKRTLNSSARRAGYCQVNGSWTNTHLFSEGMVVDHPLNLTNFTRLHSLPDNMTVNGDLILARTSLVYLPKNLTVKGTLDIRFSPIWTRPEGLNVEKIRTHAGKVL